MAHDFLTAAQRTAADKLAADLARVFAARLRVLVAYEPATAPSEGDAGGVHTLALVDALGAADLAALLTVVPAWHKAGLATPLLLSREEFERTLDVFPVEYQSIVSRHVVVAGAWPEGPMTVNPADLRRACERQVKGLLIHLREAYLETHGKPAEIAGLVRASVPAFRSSLRNVAILESVAADTDEQLAAFAASALQMDGAVVREVLGFAGRGQAAAAAELLPRYMNAVEQLWRSVDRHAT